LEASRDTVRFADLVAAGEPVIIKGLISDWPLVRAGAEGPEAALAYLAGFDAGRAVVGYTGDPAIGGRYHYDATLTGVNFVAERTGLATYLDRLRATLGDGDAPSLYLGSTDLDLYLPGFRGANDVPLGEAVFQDHPPLASIWIGNRTTAPAHWDMSNNIAACAVGRRRFTLFPPDQVANLYPGPLEPTPAGQVVTMVDFRDPDLERFPRFAQAMEHALVAELDPGDVLVYPALWWHQVEALGAINAMVNYWWNDVPSFVDTPMTTLLHGLLSLRDRPAAEKQAWRAMFDYYVFGAPERPAAHLPDHARGALAPLDATGARRLRAQVMQKLNR
jgi:hypothetical protein